MLLLPHTAPGRYVLLLLGLAASATDASLHLLKPPISEFVKPSVAKLVQPAAVAAAVAAPGATSTTQEAGSSRGASPQAVPESSPGVQHITLNHKPYASSPAAAINFTIYPAAGVLPAAAHTASPL
jgi:hypothetical protein